MIVISTRASRKHRRSRGDLWIKTLFSRGLGRAAQPLPGFRGARPADAVSVTGPPAHTRASTKPSTAAGRGDHGQQPTEADPGGHRSRATPRPRLAPDAADQFRRRAGRCVRIGITGERLTQQLLPMPNHDGLITAGSTQLTARLGSYRTG